MTGVWGDSGLGPSEGRKGGCPALAPPPRRFWLGPAAPGAAPAWIPAALAAQEVWPRAHFAGAAGLKAMCLLRSHGAHALGAGSPLLSLVWALPSPCARRHSRQGPQGSPRGAGQALEQVPLIPAITSLAAQQRFRHQDATTAPTCGTAGTRLPEGRLCPRKSLWVQRHPTCLTWGRCPTAPVSPTARTPRGLPGTAPGTVPWGGPRPLRRVGCAARLPCSGRSTRLQAQQPGRTGGLQRPNSPLPAPVPLRV